MPGKSKKGGGLESSPVYKKQGYGEGKSPFTMRSGNTTPFKMMGSSPVKYEKEKVGPRVEKNLKKEFIKKEVSPYTLPPSAKRDKPKTEQPKRLQEGLKALRNIDRDSVKPPKKETKKKKGTWFGMPDLGVTETTSRVIDYFMPKR